LTRLERALFCRARRQSWRSGRDRNGGHRGIARIAGYREFVGASSLYRTAPVGLKHQPDFINAVVELNAVSPAPTFLDMLFAIEARFGRQRSVRNAPRTLDLDLLLYGDELSDDPVLTLPHPRLHERAFVLAPLAEMAPQLVIPGLGAVVRTAARCADQTDRTGCP
jgi:2-amino-4-hydroxy-6-hydroxymethyldihydropteridine diphosphokinase